MMLTGRRGRTGSIVEPRVVQLQISRYTRTLPRRNEPLEFLVAMHMEGSATTWQRNVSLPRDKEQQILEDIEGLRRWSAGVGLTRRSAQAAAHGVGRMLRDVFLGRQGCNVLAATRATALLLMVDETVIHLPWEMMLDAEQKPLVLTPFGRVLTTRVMSPSGRDLATEDATVRILAVENPTNDLAAAEQVMEVIESLRDVSADLTVEVTTLARDNATRRAFVDAVTGHDFDIIHFAGHGRFDEARQDDGAVVLADGLLTDEHVMKLKWERPPFVVLNGSCESGRAAPGQRMVSIDRRSNGLAAAFLSRGVEAYLGHYFFVDDSSAADFSQTFYSTLLGVRNVGTAVQAARDRALFRFASDVDLTGLGAVFFGDAGTAERRDLATAV
jgi:CHAT domain